MSPVKGLKLRGKCVGPDKVRQLTYRICTIKTNTTLNSMIEPKWGRGGGTTYYIDLKGHYVWPTRLHQLLHLQILRYGSTNIFTARRQMIGLEGVMEPLLMVD